MSTPYLSVAISLNTPVIREQVCCRESQWWAEHRSALPRYLPPIHTSFTPGPVPSQSVTLADVLRFHVILTCDLRIASLALYLLSHHIYSIPDELLKYWTTLGQLCRHALMTSICFIRNTDGEKLGENGQAGDSRTLLMLELCALSSILELCTL